MTEIRSTAGLIWHPRVPACAVTGAKLVLELNRAGQLTFTLPPEHPAQDAIEKLKTEFWALQDGEEIFRGRALYTDRDVKNRLEVCCEGLLNRLRDDVVRPGDLSADGTYSGSAAGLIDRICAAVNGRRTGGVPLARGNVDGFGTVTASASEYPTALELLDGVRETAGGYFFLRRFGGYDLIDYTKSPGGDGGQTIRFGENLLELLEHATGEEYFSTVIPLGKDGLTVKTATAAAGRDFIEPAGVSPRVERVVKFDDIEDADALYAAGASVVGGAGLVTTLELTAADLADAGADVDRLRLGRSYRVSSPPHGLELRSALGKIDADLLHPADAVYTFGAEAASLTKAYRSAKKQAEQARALAAVAMNKANAAATPGQVATEIAAGIAASEARVADYVTEAGTTDGWTWRKWASGLRECRRVAEIAIAAGGYTAWGSVFAYSTTAPYPTGFFDAAPELLVSPCGGSGCWTGMLRPSEHTAAQAAISVLRAQNTTAATTVRVALHAYEQGAST